MASIHDVAQRSGVSTATVSRALRGLPNVSPVTRQRVQEAADALGYIPSPSASGLSSGRTGAVAVVVPSLTRWFFTEVVEGVDAALRVEGYDTFLVDLAVRPGERERLFSHTLLRKRADAVIALGIRFTGAERSELRSLPVPVAIVGAPLAGLRGIGVDDAAVSRSAIQHLVDLGHHRIAHVGGHDRFGLDRSVADLRERAWRAELRDRGLPLLDHWFASGGFLLPQSKAAALTMLQRPDRPTGVFAGSDEMAFGVLLAAAELGIRVPEDLSVVGIDDHSWSAAFHLTTVRQDPHEQGAAAAAMVLAQLAGTPPPIAPIAAPHELIVRGTTAAAARSRRLPADRDA
ncbi:LacI family DNA-binding transcriptional regulator [uncultured Amnibacterium sp.]|uniref:LacI family DNA-binding transcriptional regulator n=1 Tax=uncultured Amnibacterium sp. TaxID=1631851 RepID=UPI0035CBCEDD